MIRRLKLYPFHAFLFIPFIVMFLYAQNLGQTKPYMTYRTLWLGTLLSLALYGLFYLLLKSRLKAGVIVSFVLFAFFQYGVVYEFFESLYYRGRWPLNNIHRYLLSVYFIILAASVWWTRRTKHDFIKINYFLNALVSLLLLYNLLRIAFGHYAQQQTETVESGQMAEKITFSAGSKRPDVYYIILDGYASNNVLSKYYGYKNDAFVRSLKDKGFRFCDSAFANYYYTSASLAATLNFDYLEGGIDRNNLLWDNRAFKTFKDNGYTICHMKSGYAVTSYFRVADKTITIDGPNEFEKSLLKYTILRLDDLLGLFAHLRLSSQFEKMNSFVAIQARPKFCFMHFVAPHPPYIFDRNGRLRTRHRFAEHSWEPKEYYVDQLEYVNKQVSRLINQILSSDPGAVILIQSDHGPWIQAERKEQVFEARSQILYAYYCQGLKVPDKTSPVNTFRYLFNSVYGCQLDTIADVYSGKEALLKDPILLKKAEH